MSEVALGVQLAVDEDRWAASGGTRARGYAHVDGRFLDAESLAEFMDRCATAVEWGGIVARLNGCFALVSRRGSEVLAAVDRVRSIPLFWGGAAAEAMVTDDAYRVPPSADGFDADSELEFGLTGYVTGDRTLRPGVRQLEAGTWMRWQACDAAPTVARYHAFAHGDFLGERVPDLIDRLVDVHAGAFARLVEGVRGRRIVVPLSGGYDSRLIGVSLRDQGLRDVLCYSYGVPGNWESRISKELADYLGFRWEFVPYDAAQWRAWSATREFGDYFHRAGNLASVPHVQDWPAIRELARAGVLVTDDVIVPGHSGDFLAGSHVPTSFLSKRTISRRETLDAIQRAHYSLWDWPEAGGLRDVFDRRIERVVGPVADGSPEYAADVFERWDLQERQAKFVCNSMRVYEQAGLEWRLPLFDAELMDFWCRIPVELRVERKLYLAFAGERQRLPITPANTDYGLAMRAAVRVMDVAGLRPVGERLRRLIRRIRWRSAYATAPLAWTALVEPMSFRRSYTGKEIMHSYLARSYSDYMVSLSSGAPRTPASAP